MDSAQPTDPGSLSPSLDRRIDEVCDQFKAAWREGRSPRIAEYLARAPAAARSKLLVSLVELDLECRWQSGDHRRIEVYLAEWPELKTEQGTLLELASCECRIRLQHGDRPTLTE